LAFKGSTNAVSINTASFSGTDTTVTPNVNRDYILNVEGDVNINGDLYQDNALFVTSRWTESTNDSGANIYRNSKVGIGNVTAPAYQLDVGGDINTTGSLSASGDDQWLDTYGIIKTNRNNINEDLTIPSNTNAVSAGPITINTGKTVTISSDANWSIV
jgi:hypothetical protein